MRSCDLLEEEKHSGFLVFSSFLRWFLPIFVHLSTCCLSSCWLFDWVWVDAQIVDDEVFLLLGFPSTSLAPLLYDCWGPLQALLVWGTPVAAAEQWGMLPVSSSAIFVPDWCPPNVSLISPFCDDFLDIQGSGSCLRRQSVLYRSSSAELWAPLFIQGC